MTDSTDSRRLPLLVSLITVVVAGVLFFGPAPSVSRAHAKWFQFFKNFENNNNHENWACYDYAFDMMNSTEPNSIFFTEGGDNQVFSLLYFSYCERKRPDVDFFDQKGNVFPRLYGDLMNMSPDDLEIVRDLRDFELYSTGRPIYLTWRRPNLHRLTVSNLTQKVAEVTRMAAQQNPPRQPWLRIPWKLDTLADIENAMNTMVPKATFNMVMRGNKPLSKQHLRYLGPWYFQTYGLLQKVAPLRYAIVDGLEVMLQADESRLRDYVKGVSQYELSSREFNQMVDELAAEGLVARAGAAVSLVKRRPRPFQMENEDYWKRYAMRYTNVPNASDWDYMTIEIMNNYHGQQLSLAMDQWQWNRDRARDPGVDPVRRAQFEAKSAAHYAELFRQQDFLIKFCNKLGGQISYNAANLYLRFGRTDEALSNFRKATLLDRDFFGISVPAGLNAAMIHLQRSLAGPALEESNQLLEARRHYRNVSNLLVKQYRMSGAYSSLPTVREYRMAQSGLGRVEAALGLPRTAVEAQIARAAAGGIPERMTLAQLYERRQDFEAAAATYEQVLSREPGNLQVFFAYVNCLSRFDFNRTLQVMEGFYNANLNRPAVDPSLKGQFEEQIGMLYFQMGQVSLQQNDAAGAYGPFMNAKSYFDRFRVTAMPSSANPEVRRRIIQAEKISRELTQRLDMLRGYLRMQQP